MSILLLGALICFGSPRMQQPSEESQLGRGIRLLSQGRISDAVAAFNRFKQSNPQDARPYFYSGTALLEAGRLEAAALELSEAVRLDPQRLEYQVLQANLFTRLKQSAPAEAVLSAIKGTGIAERLDASWLWLLSEAYYRLERFDDALRVLDLLEKRNPDDPRLDLNRGQVQVFRREFDLAQLSFEKSIAKFPDNPITHFELGNLLYQRSDMPAAKKSLLNAVRLNNNNPEYLQRLGAVCLALEEIDPAMGYLQRALALDPANPQIYLSLGQACQRKGEREKALEFRRKYQEISLAKRQKESQQEEIDRLLARGERMLDEGKDTEARAAFEQIVQSKPDNWTAHAYLAEMFLLSQDWQKAQPHLEKMETLDAESVVGNYLMARHWYLRKEFERARAYAEKVKQSRPAHAELRNLLGQIYLGLGERDRASDEFDMAVRLAPNRADFRENLQKLKKQ